MSTGAAVVERRTPESRIAVAATAVIIALLAVGPAIFSANAVDKLTTLFHLCHPGLMWKRAGRILRPGRSANRLLWLGAYAAIRLADLGVSVYPSVLGRTIVGALSWPPSPSCSGSRAANSLSACGWCRN